MSESLRTQDNVAMLGALVSLRLNFAQSTMACTVAVSPRRTRAFCSSQMSFFRARVRVTYSMANGLVALHQQTVSHSKKAVMPDAELINTGKDCRNVI